MSNHDIHRQDGFAHLVLILIVVGALLVGSATFIYGQQRKDDSLASANNASAVSLTQPLPTDLLGADRIKTLAASDKPDLQVRQIELEAEDGVLLYKVRMSDGSFILYNARSGVKVTKDSGQSAEVEKDDGLPNDFVAGISFERARAIALQQKPEGQIRKIELENESGVVVYSVRFTDDARVDVNASDGSIVRTRAAKKASTPSSGSSGATQSTGSSGSGTSGSTSSGNSGSGSSGSSHSGDDDSHDDNSSDDSHDDESGSDDRGSNSGSGSSGSDDDN